MLSVSMESHRFGAFAIAGEPADPRKSARISVICAIAILAHAGLAGFVAWTESGAPEAGATAAVEIPVEMATPEEADGRPKSQQAGKAPAAPTAIEPHDEAPSQPAKQARAADAAGGRTEGKVVERPKDSDKPQAARTHGADAKPEEGTEEPANPFGGLTDVDKPAPSEPVPTFLSPQSMMTTARPKPAQDPTNDNYRARVLGKVAANMIDPERPRPKALAIVGFRVDAQGNIESAWLARPSGHADLDAEALDMVRRSAPFPAPPAGADRNFGAAIAFGGDGG